MFLLYLMEHNANRCEAAKVLNEIYKEFELGKKRVRSRQPRPPPPPLYTRNVPRIEDAAIGYVDAVSKP